MTASDRPTSRSSAHAASVRTMCMCFALGPMNTMFAASTASTNDASSERKPARAREGEKCEPKTHVSEAINRPSSQDVNWRGSMITKEKSRLIHAPYPGITAVQPVLDAAAISAVRDA